jgi:hypothetical protein
MTCSTGIYTSWKNLVAKSLNSLRVKTSPEARAHVQKSPQGVIRMVSDEERDASAMTQEHLAKQLGNICLRSPR